MQRIEQHMDRAKVLAVTSGKGGVGKTNIATNLSISLAKCGKQVSIIDADLGLGNLDILMNINSRFNLRDVIDNGKSLDEIICIGPCGVEVVCGGSGFTDLADMDKFKRQRLVNEISKLESNRDVIVIDTAAGIHSSVVGFCQAADHTLVVTTPESTAMADAYAMIKVLSANNYDGRISVVVNMASSVVEGKKVYRQIADVARRFLNYPVYEAGVLCRDDRLTASVKAREPVVISYPKSQVALSLTAMAARLGRVQTAAVSRDGFLRKVANWFF